MPTEETISIEGTLLMLDDTTPHVAVVVQAIRDGEVVATTLSNVNGKYQFVNLRPGHYQLRCYTIDGYLYYGKDRPVDSSHAASLKVQSGKALENIDFCFAPLKKGTWRTYTYLDGLAGNYIRSFYCDPDGVMWFGTISGGVSRYDGKEFVNLTARDGLGSNYVTGIYRDPDGVMWFGTNVGVSRYDGKEFASFTTEDGLAGSEVRDIHRDPDGVMWFGTSGGVSRYDGEDFVNLTTKDGLAHNSVWKIHRDPDGVMWFATWGGGVSRYDGKDFVNFTIEDGLAHNYATDIYCDPDGVVWFATGGWVGNGGVSRYDGVEFVNLTTRDGLVNDHVHVIHRDSDGVMWFGAWGHWDMKEGGVSRYDGKEFVDFTTKDGLVDNHVKVIYRDPDGVLWFGTGIGVSRYDDRDMGDSPNFVNFTTEDGLAANPVGAIHRDPDGVMWFATGGGGVSGYDGVAWTSLDTRDGLAGNGISSILQDSDGYLWFGTEGGITRYRRSATPPKARIVSVTTDQTYRDLSDIPAFTPGTRVTIEYNSIDFKTLPEKRQYRCRIYETQDSRPKTEDRTRATVLSLESWVLDLTKHIILLQRRRTSIGYPKNPAHTFLRCRPSTGI